MNENGFGPILGVVLCGGLARRMGGGDKCLLPLAGKPILQHILDRFSPQVSDIILNANGDADRFSDFGLTVVSDVIDGFAGPLAGVLTGLEWGAANRPDVKWIATVPGDGPFLPGDLVERFCRSVELDKSELACAYRGDRSQPVIGLWPVALRTDLRKAIEIEDIHKVDRWTSRFRLSKVAFDDGEINPFFNTNRQEDLDEAEILYAQLVG